MTSPGDSNRNERWWTATVISQLRSGFLRQAEEDVNNESTPERERRLRVSLGIAYDSDLEHVEDVLLDVARDADVVIDEPAPRVRVREFAASSINVDLLAWISAPVLRGRARHVLLKQIHAAFRNEGIEIPFPQRVVTTTDEDAADDGPLPDSADERVSDSERDERDDS
jgi:small-conductance mechanosensitive channel